MSQGAPQRLIANRYAIDRILRQGRAGVVWHATDTVDGAAVAIEEIEPAAESEAERDARWSRVVQAARCAAGLRHPGAVKLLDVLLDGERYFVVSELVDALALSELIDRHGRVPVRRVARIGLEVHEVLAAAHDAGFAHLDLQPAHVLVAPDGAVRVGGFGLDAVLAPSRRPPVPAPEQVRGEPAGPPADLWALGVTMYEAVEGQPPFAGGDAEILYAGPRPCEHAGPLAPLIESLLERVPERRAQAAGVRERLRAIAGGATTAPGQLGGLGPMPWGAPSAGGPNGDPVPVAAGTGPRLSLGAPPVGGVPATTSTATPPLIARTRPSEAATTVIGRVPVVGGRAAGSAGPVGFAARAGAAGRAARAAASARLGGSRWRDALDWMLDPTRRGLMVGSASVALALLSFALIVATIGSNPAGSGARTRAALPPGTTAAPPTTTAPTTTVPPTTAPALPAGWTGYADQASGYRIAYPASWEVVQRDRGIEFHDRSVPTIMRISLVPSPVPDPVAAQLQSSQQHAELHQGSYQQTRLEPSNFQGRPGAVLEFTFLGEDQQPYRAVELGTNTPPGPNGPGYWVTIFVQSREVDWGVAQSLLATALSSFVPPPS